MIEITLQVISKVAGLIRIFLGEEEKQGMVDQLSKVLDSVEVLNELDVQNVQITSQTHGLTNVLRADEPMPGLDISKYPNRRNIEGNYFAVKKVL